MYIPQVRASRHPRRGTIYMLVIMSSAIVATIGLASLQLLRLQGRIAREGNDLIEARLYARTAVELGMLKIQTDSNWRKNLGDGAWITDQAIGQGRYSINVVDPIDNKIEHGNNHPVLITGVGNKGNATFNTTVRMEVGLPEGSALEVSMMSGSYTSVYGATLTSDQTVGSNNFYYAWGGAVVNANVEAASIWGSTYTKSKLTSNTARDLPDTSTVFDYYTSNGTSIGYNSLPQWNRPEMLTNTTFETNTSNWYASGSCNLSRSLSVAKQGSASMLVSGRSSSSSVAAQDLTPTNLALFLNGHDYTLTMPIYCTSSCTGRVQLTVFDSSGGNQTFTGPTTNVYGNSWTNLTDTISPTWSGTVTKATISVVLSTSNNYYTDAVTLTDVTYPYNAFVIDRKLISPSSNPFGGQTNAEGIYVINCNGNDLIIADSRIVGTLVLIKPGSNSSIQKSVTWEPAVVNYPALLSDSSLNIAFNSSGLSESSLNANFNPDSTPYPFFGGTSNSTLTDSFPSKIVGIVYSAKDLTFSGASTISGVVIANDTISVTSTSLNLQYSNTYLNNFPPGFDLGVTKVKPVPGTWMRTVN